VSHPWWGELFDHPVFVFSADQDWAPEWAIEALLDATIRQDIPLHLFLTNDSPAVRAAAAGSRLTLGIHPNFLPGSTHGATPEAVIASCMALAPGADTFRCHSFFEYTRVLGMLYASGFRADSNLGLFAQPGLVPLIHCTGLLRFPVFFEDDVFFNLADADLSLAPLAGSARTAGLKIVNVHPSLIGLNAPSQGYYDDMRARLFGDPGSPPAAYAGRGVRHVLGELIELARASGEITSFPDIVRRSFNALSAAGVDLYAWGRRAWSGPAVPRDRSAV
jgi:hypothetical protein